MWKRWLKNDKRGFTLVEMLGVVAIIVVVLAVAIPSIISINKSLQFKRMNDYAKTIFMAAQNNLTEMRSTGKLNELLVNDAGTGMPDGANLVTATNNANFPTEDWSAQYCYTSSGDAFDMVLPAGTVEQVLRQNQILIEYNPVTGNVFSVFYSEGDQPLSYDNVTRDEGERREKMLGYYQGSGLSGEPIELNPTTPYAEVDVNGEENVLNVYVPIPDEFLSNPTSFMNALQFEAVVTGEQRDGSFTVEASEFAKKLQSGNTVVASFCLDSLRDKASFASLAQNNPADPAVERNLTEITAETDSFYILPGENLNIEIDITSAGVPVDYDPLEVSGVNSMFSALTEVEVDGEEQYYLYLTNGRHLQNLNAIAPSIAEKVAQVYFAGDIYWNKTVDYYDEKYGDADGYENDGAEAPARALPYFVPIASEALFGEAHFNVEESGFIIRDKIPVLSDTDNEKNATIQGGGNRVYYLNIDAAKYDIGKAYYAGNEEFSKDRFTGLFAYLDTDVYGLNVVNPRVKGVKAGNPATGALAGASGHQTYFYECGVYIDTEDEDFNWGEIDNYKVTGYGAVGGLVGYAKSHNTIEGPLVNNKNYLAFSNCFAAIPVEGTMSSSAWEGWLTTVGYGYSNGVGGLVGCSILTNFYNCYASGDIIGHNPRAQLGSSWFCQGIGGFVGTSHGTKYTNCFSTGDVNGYGSDTSWLTNKDSVGGFVGVMCTDEQFSYGSQTIKQITMFNSCYAVGVTRANDEPKENFSGYNTYLTNWWDDVFDGKIEWTDFMDDGGNYYEAYANNMVGFWFGWDASKEEPNSNGEYLFKDSYYLNLYQKNNQGFSNQCAEVVSYEMLANLPGFQQKRSQPGHPMNDWEDRESLVGWNKMTEEEKAIIRAKYLDGFKSSASGGAWAAASVDNTHSYVQTVAPNSVYPFTKLAGMDYYGEWPSYPLDIGLAYYEQYSDGTYGYYLDSNDTSTLQNDKVVVSDGYALLSLNGNPISTTVGSVTESINTNGQNVVMGNVVYYVFPLSWNLMNAANVTGGASDVDNLYAQLNASVSGTTFTMYFNPRFALTQVNPVRTTEDDHPTTAAKPTALPAAIAIRTWRQFCALGAESAFWGEGFHFQQQLDIDKDSYIKTYFGTDISAKLNPAPIGSDAVPFQGSYNGTSSASNYKINLYEEANIAGLFGVIGEKGKVSALNIVADKAFTVNLENSESVGILAAVNNGSIENVSFSMQDVSLTAKTNAGIVAGSSTGSVKNCSVKAKNVDITAKNAGAFVGNTSSTATTSAATVTVDEFTAAASKSAGVLAGILEGKADNLTVTCPSVQLTGNDTTAFLGGVAGSAANLKADHIQANLLAITGCGNTAGMFGKASNVTVNDAQLELKTVVGEGDTAGAAAQAEEFNTTGVQINAQKIQSNKAGAAGFAVSASGSASACAVHFGKMSAREQSRDIIVAVTNAAGFVGTHSGSGSYNGCTVTGEGTIRANNMAAGFVGVAEGTVSNCIATPVESADGNIANAYQQSGNDRLVIEAPTSAGFVNSVNGVVQKCIALGTVKGETVSGFAGENGGKVSNSVSNITLNGTETNSGFVSENTKEIENCYTWYNISAEQADGTIGFAANNTGSIKGAYAAPLGVQAVTPFAPEGGTFAGCFGVAANVDGNMSSVEGIKHVSAGQLSYLPTQQLNEYGWQQSYTYTAYPYSEELNGGYPYPMLQDMPHYGDWSVPPKYDYGVAYYEVADEKYYWQITALSVAGATLVEDTLSKIAPEADITESGYAVFYNSSTQIESVIANNSFMALENLDTIEQIVSDQLQGYTFKKVASTIWEENDLHIDAAPVVKEGVVPTVITVKGRDGGSAEIIPYFASAIKVGDAEGMPFRLRSADQLKNMWLYPADDYQIARDIDLKSEPFPAMFSDTVPFTGSIVGSETVQAEQETDTVQYAIENYTGSSALFGTVQGAQLTDILLRNADVTASDDMQNIGVLVDQMDESSVLSGCAVETAAISLENEETTDPTQPAEQVEQTVQQNIGVLAGFSSGSIENCRVEELSINVQQKQNVANAAEATATEQNVGGLVGAMQSGSLSESFASGKITITTAEETTTSQPIAFAVGGAVGADLQPEQTEGAEEKTAVYTDSYARVEILVQPSQGEEVQPAELTEKAVLAGKFVGSVYNGQFQSCYGLSEQEMQFLGKIYSEEKTLELDPVKKYYSSDKLHEEEPFTLETDKQGEYQDLAAVTENVTYTDKDSYKAVLENCYYGTPKSQPSTEEQPKEYQLYEQMIVPETSYYTMEEKQISTVIMVSENAIVAGTNYFVVPKNSSIALAVDGSSVSKQGVSISDVLDGKPFDKDAYSNAIWTWNGSGDSGTLSNNGQNLNIGSGSPGLNGGNINAVKEKEGFAFYVDTEGGSIVSSAKRSYLVYASTTGFGLGGGTKWWYESNWKLPDGRHFDLYQIIATEKYQGTFAHEATDYICTGVPVEEGRNLLDELNAATEPKAWMISENIPEEPTNTAYWPVLANTLPVLGKGEHAVVVFQPKTDLAAQNVLPSASPTPTPTATPEPSPSVTPKPTPSATPQPSPSITPESSPSATPEPTPSTTPEPTPSATPQPSPSVTPEPTPTASPEADASGPQSEQEATA